MLKHAYLFLLVLVANCQDQSVDLPKDLNEVSGNETTIQNNGIWMLNDSGNKSHLFLVNEEGNIEKKLKIDAKNHDWEDITSDEKGNIYIGDFGNNGSDRKHLKILKVNASNLDSDDKIDVETISFTYEDQDDYSPKKSELYFDCEAFFYFNNNFYLFTKTRVNNEHGKTKVYKLPAKSGKQKAKLIGNYNFGDNDYDWVTAADIRDDGKEIVILTQHKIHLFSNFTSDNFFNGKHQTIGFNSITQKEGICYKNNNTLFLTDEKNGDTGGRLYTIKID
ncbi:hypothetical protein LG651_05120 [Tamlana sp. 62-3]|uniref:T9SS C-terminal target domain-containing protein n=1 Tax=Neotamlana sargassicola TaxID=2883125 RepID=A0A9X1L3X9_9FLAO|nr:hypothetical protein [Tamlana sargassicola]MCB4807622.1 hypothetical protein [Tamlana sargassicola]